MQNKFPFLNNNLFNTYTLEIEFPQSYKFIEYKEEAKAALDSIKALYDKEKFQKQNEHQFEDEFIAKVLEILGWHSIRQDEKIIQGRLERPDFLLFISTEEKDLYQQIKKEQRKSSNANISVILESKAYNVEIDNKKTKDNPHFQLLSYLNNLKIKFGFLSNGRLWRLYDSSILSSQKIFYEINLESIIETDNLEGFYYFYHIFHARNFTSDEGLDSTTLTNLLAKNAESKMNIENDLRAIIYGIEGKSSLFEFIGARIYQANPSESLDSIYQNTLYFLFRLLFISYFEDKFDSILDRHEYFNDEISLNALAQKNNKDGQRFNTFKKLQDMFRIYNKGEPNYDMPIFNGGLFDESKAELLQKPKLFSNNDLAYILDSLFCFKIGGGGIIV